ncbi:MAG: glycosyltransferase family 4 protein [Acidobacteriota bacterium]|nr:glycosyltransferase family 4 protein [Acidobacteriota bacterium]
MNLLIYSHFFSPSIGGVENIVQSLATGIAKLRNINGDREFHVTLATGIPAGSTDDKQFPFEIIRQPNFLTLWRLIRHADVVHLAGPALLPMLLAWISRKKYVIEHHGYQAICPNGLLVQHPARSICPGYFQAARYGECFKCLHSEFSSRRVAAQLLLLMFPRYWLARDARKNIAVTHHVAQRQKLPRTEVVYHGIEDPLPGERESTSLPAARLCIACVGRLVPEKGIPVLLEAARLLKLEGRDFEIRLIGDGSERPRLEGFIQRENLQSCVFITGFLSSDALAAALRDVNVVVMPSTWEETAGLAAIEQMMRGRLVVAADIGGLREVVGDTGMKFLPGDGASLAHCLRNIITNPVLVTILGQAARERALNLFNWPSMIANHAQIYRSQ